jgi:energy-coupling factor transporter ATP-binding protein EcfA2
MRKKDLSFREAGSITVPREFFSPIPTGLAPVDRTFSEMGGLVPSQVVIATGKPGSGKTTLMLAIAGALSTRGKRVAFISLEMSEFQLAHQAKKIAGFNRCLVSSEFELAGTLRLLESTKPDLVILDSIQKAARNDKDQVKLVEEFTKFAKKHWVPVVLIGHCTKGGVYKGPSDLVHEVDSHLMVNFDRELDLRSWVFEKNRFGGSVAEEFFGITSTQVWLGNPYPDLPKGEDAMAVAMRERLAILEAAWTGTNIRSVVEGMVEMLRVKDDQLPSRGVEKNPSKVTLKWEGNHLADCDPKRARIRFGKKVFADTFQIGQVGYGKEQKYIAQRVRSRSELLAWVVIHEWVHLYEGMDKHTNNFFDTVLELANKFPLLWENRGSEMAKKFGM